MVDLNDRLTLVAADDHALFLQGLRSLFATSERYWLVATAANGDDLIGLIKTHTPDVAIADVSMPGPDPLSLMKTAARLSPATKVLALTMHSQAQLAARLLDAGLAGYVLKEAAFDDLEHAVETVAAGKVFVSEQLASAVAALREQAREDQASESKNRLLTGREIAVLKMAAAGATGKEIARQLGITERTVRFHVANSCRKLGVARRAQAISTALRLGLIPDN